MDPYELTYGEFLAYLKQLAKCRRFEAGEDPNGSDLKRMTPEQIAEAVTAGRLTPEDLKQLKPRALRMSDVERRQEEARVRGMFAAARPTYSRL